MDLLVLALVTPITPPVTPPVTPPCPAAGAPGLAGVGVPIPRPGAAGVVPAPGVAAWACAAGIKTKSALVIGSLYFFRRNAPE
jgi:hypothetical protein